MYSRPIQRLIQAFRRLPSVGERTAERYVFYLLKSGKKEVGELTLALRDLMAEVKSCEICWDFSDKSPCTLCTDKTRDNETLCVVADSQDVHAIERIGSYSGLFHVLRGTVRPDDDSFDQLKIPELLARAKDAKEIILALNPDLPGETTMMLLEKKLSAKGVFGKGGKESNPSLVVSRLARGLPMGSDLQYADEVTLGSAMKNRTQTK